MEGKLATDKLRDLVTLQKSSAENAKKITKTIENLNSTVDGLGFCLTEAKDRLSQWRGYADDGKGVSIGFSRKYLEEKICRTSQSGVGIDLEKVVYDKHDQDVLLMQVYESLSKWHNTTTGGEDVRFEIAKQLIKNRFKIKCFSFQEEAEWRLLSFFVVGAEFHEDILFRAMSNRLTPYLEIPLAQNSGSILEVVLGPKNTTPLEVILMFLNNKGFYNVKVEQSKSTYR
jgi:hypothetical protein